MKKRKQRRVPIKTGRVVHHFWLNIWKPLEGELDNQVAQLKKQRQFAETVRDGLRLILDLRAGSLSVLFELFPHLQERLTAQPAPVSQPPAPDTSELAKEIATQLILRGGKDTLQMMQGGQQPDSNRTGQLTGKQLAAPSFAMPTFDDDDDTPTVIVNRSTDMSSAANFLTALQHMQ